MRLLVTTPTTVAVDEKDVVSIRAEDESGGFGVLEGHADFLTTLGASVVGWHCSDGSAGYCAVRRGLLTVAGGHEVSIAVREAVVDKDLDRLEHVVVARFRAAGDAERAARVDSLRLHMKAIRQIVRYLRPERAGGLGQSG